MKIHDPFDLSVRFRTVLVPTPITGAGQAKINLFGPHGAPELVFSIGIKRSDMRRLMLEVIERRDTFLQEWESIHGRID